MHYMLVLTVHMGFYTHNNNALLLTVQHQIHHLQPLPSNPTFSLHTCLSTSVYFLSKFPCSVCCLMKKLDSAARAANPSAATHTPLKLST
jgi:hypothetical protein